MRRLIFATNNKHKLQEVRAALEGRVEVLSLSDVGLSGDIPETADTLQGNAQQKAEWVWERVGSVVDGGQLVVGSSLGQTLPTTHYPLPTKSIDGVFADDTGLEVESLDGAPGVYSARYAAMSGERDLCGANAAHSCSFDDNIDKLLAALDGKANRRACFRTVICLLEQEAGGGEQVAAAPATRYFEGRVDGQILTERRSNGEGFGYDPVFMPDRFAVSFAEMPLDVKNRISHRGLAVAKLVEYLMK